MHRWFVDADGMVRLVGSMRRSHRTGSQQTPRDQSTMPTRSWVPVWGSFQYLPDMLACRFGDHSMIARKRWIPVWRSFD